VERGELRGGLAVPRGVEQILERVSHWQERSFLSGMKGKAAVARDLRVVARFNYKKALQHIPIWRFIGK
jgi:hypothetical protein